MSSATVTKPLAALRAAFPHTLPVLAGYLFLGMTYGVCMRLNGYPFWVPMLMALVIYGGSLEYIAIELLVSPFAPLQTFLTALMIQARHLFYGVAMLDRYQGTGWKKFFLIYTMSDETFAVDSSVDIPPSVDRGWFLLWIGLLDQSYWILGAGAGGLLGSVLPFNTEGLDFVMTAMFVVIFLDRWLKESQHSSALIGLAASLACLLVFGADSFLIPSMICILLLLTALRAPIEKAGDPQ